ncbi:SGNH/GDSL hydrolase family protein [Saccharothrix algeriensis]|uniref:Lysophospholipase L1-like esterase n=1 Tax=Saccharothrix algeriensis TaxID=173560 RepID=A0A8T8I1D5_9PSEU|nr:SGNH/GDSL hydrolase family protein [Saccharothrix algeriensis]MBM7810564.1 lysophospholipase L1-like esterase [Saccharothrix algeriensis]QTR04665.1 SGNH/GDSL hydrolase family protein [Saccharothrix algeriensis]
MNILPALLVAALTPAPAPVAPEYVALGDSYAAGVGAHREDCGRTANAHPALYASAKGLELVFAACGGATTEEVEEQVERITPETSLVTLTVGGNDAGFTDVLTACVLRGDEACERRVAGAERFLREELPERLDELNARVRERTSAPVVVLGYPRLFAPRGGCSLSVDKRAALNRAADVLNEVVRARAEAAGFGFADVRDAFEGHGVCSDDPWINDLSLTISDSYHPNSDGHRLGYLPALTRAAP